MPCSPAGSDIDASKSTHHLAVDQVWIPAATERHAEVFGSLIDRYRLADNLIPDAHLAAIAIEHGLEICSADTDFARFTDLRWRNPLADGD
jgi:uncharacterized protein